MPTRLSLARPSLVLVLTACANACDVSRALWVATAHGSYAPPRAARREIAARESLMVAQLATARIAVRPVAVLGRPTRADTAAARALADALRARGLGAAVAMAPPDTLPFTPQPNELAIYWTRFRALAAATAQAPPADADYVLQVDVFGAPERGLVGAVHAMAVSRDGAMTYGRLWNSHQPLFKERPPHSTADAVAMVVRDLERTRRGR